MCRGQRSDQRRPETTETVVVVLITQRSQVQILPPLPVSAVQGPFPVERALGVTGHVTTTGDWCPPGDGTGWGGARQRRTRLDATMGISGRIARTSHRCTSVRTGPAVTRAHAGMSVSGGAVTRQGHKANAHALSRADCRLSSLSAHCLVVGWRWLRFPSSVRAALQITRMPAAAGAIPATDWLQAAASNA